MLVGKIRNLFVESPLWLLGWLNHHHSWLSQKSIVTNPTFKKAFRKAFRIQISSNLDFGDQNIDHSWDDPTVGVLWKPMDFRSRPWPGGPGKPAQLLWRTCRRVSWPWENPGSWGITSASWTRRLWGVDRTIPGENTGAMETLDVRIWGGDCDFSIGQWLVNAPELGNHWDYLTTCFFWWPLKQI